jgi:hypothetical protein
MVNQSFDRTPLRSSRAVRANPNALAGWDIGLAALALACMTTGFWRLWPEASQLNEAPLGPIMLKAGLAALGFVGIASRWEDALRAFSRNPLALVLIALACASSIWAVVPAEALRHGILFLVIWGFGIALTLRFKSTELAEICGFAGIFALVMQMTAHKGVPPMDHFDGDLAFALVGCAWAAWSVPTRRTIWIIATGICAAFAFASGDTASLGAGLGLMFGLILAQVGARLGKKGAVSILVTAWLIVAFVVALTAFVMFGADPVSDSVSRYFSDLGPNMVIGQGFGVAGQSASDSIGAGLGILGLGVAALVVLATFFQALFGNPSGGTASTGYVGVSFACVGAILASPSEVTIFGPICLLFAGASFSISLACARRPMARQPLLQRPNIASAPLPKRSAAFAGGMKSASTKPASQVRSPLVKSPELTSLGLRPLH